LMHRERWSSLGIDEEVLHIWDGESGRIWMFDGGDMVTVPQQHRRKVQRKYVYKHMHKSR